MSNPLMSGNRRSSTTRIESFFLHPSEGFTAICRDHDVDVLVPRSSRMLSCSAGLSSTIRSRFRRGEAYSLIVTTPNSSSSGLVGLVTNANAPRARP